MHNNQKNATTGLSPNQVLLGYEPLLMPAEDTPTTNQMTEDRITAMKERRHEAIEALQRVVEMPPTFQPLYQKGNQVWLEATHLKLPY